MAASRRVRLASASKAAASAPTNAGDTDRSTSSEKRSIAQAGVDHREVVGRDRPLLGQVLKLAEHRPRFGDTAGTRQGVPQVGGGVGAARSRRCRPFARAGLLRAKVGLAERHIFMVARDHERDVTAGHSEVM